MSTNGHALTASDLYALSQSRKNEGDQLCHWCRSKCNRNRQHDDPYPVPFCRTRTTALNPNSLYVCDGCDLWRRTRCTVWFLRGIFADRQAILKHSWWCDGTDALAILPDDYPKLWERLLNPPRRFFLSLVTAGKDNLLQLCAANDLTEIKATTPLLYTLDGIRHTYTVYELEEAAQRGDGDGLEPGCRVLYDLLDPKSFLVKKERPAIDVGGRPKKETTGEGRMRRTVRNDVASA